MSSLFGKMNLASCADRGKGEEARIPEIPALDADRASPHRYLRILSSKVTNS